MLRFALLNLTITRLNPKGPIEGPVLDSLTDVLWRDVFEEIEIGNRARDFQDTIVSKYSLTGENLVSRVQSRGGISVD